MGVHPFPFHPFSRPQMKLAISYALSQSVKLSVYETRVVDIVVETKSLPESLALVRGGWKGGKRKQVSGFMYRV